MFETLRKQWTWNAARKFRLPTPQWKVWRNRDPFQSPVIYLSSPYWCQGCWLGATLRESLCGCSVLKRGSHTCIWGCRDLVWPFPRKNLVPFLILEKMIDRRSTWLAGKTSSKECIEVGLSSDSARSASVISGIIPARGHLLSFLRNSLPFSLVSADNYRTPSVHHELWELLGIRKGTL